MAALATATATLVGIRSLTEAAPQLLEAIGTALDWVVGGLWAVDPNGQELRCVAFWHRDDFPVPAFMASSRALVYTPGIGVPGRVLQSGQAVWFADVRSEPHFPRAEAARAEGLHGAFCFPVSSAGKVLAVLEFYSSAVQQPDNELLTMMDTVGNLLAQFIERVQAEAALERERKFMAALLENVSEGIVACDDTGTLTLFNRAARRTHGLPQAPLPADQWAEH